MESTAFIWLYLSKAFWFYLPVFIANLLIYGAFSIIQLDIPLDLYKKIKGERIIGDGRNVAGFFFFVFTALLVGILQGRVGEGFYLGTGGILGCYASSFLKRRLKIKQGGYIFFLDQTDFILGASLFYISQFELELNIFIFGLILALILHHLVNLLRKSWERFIEKENN